MTDNAETIESLQRKLAESLEQHRRSAKVQRALYAIADAASAATDTQSFYARLHEIIGELMYARNFFIESYEEYLCRLRFPYVVDEQDAGHAMWETRPLR